METSEPLAKKHQTIRELVSSIKSLQAEINAKTAAQKGLPGDQRVEGGSILQQLMTTPDDNKHPPDITVENTALDEKIAALLPRSGFVQQTNLSRHSKHRP